MRRTKHLADVRAKEAAAEGRVRRLEQHEQNLIEACAQLEARRDRALADLAAAEGKTKEMIVAANNQVRGILAQADVLGSTVQ